jgi:hypothetical protein
VLYDPRVSSCVATLHITPLSPSSGLRGFPFLQREMGTPVHLGTPVGATLVPSSLYALGSGPGLILRVPLRLQRVWPRVPESDPHHVLPSGLRWCSGVQVGLGTKVPDSRSTEHCACVMVVTPFGPGNPFRGSVPTPRAPRGAHCCLESGLLRPRYPGAMLYAPPIGGGGMSTCAQLRSSIVNASISR